MLYCGGLRSHLPPRLIHTLMTTLLEGSLDHISLFNLLQFVKMEQKTCRMTISIAEINQSCDMFFANGLIRYASVNQLTGTDAMYRIIGWWQTGNFCIRAADPADLPAANIQSAIESILLEAARRIDETAALRAQVPSLSASLSFTAEAIDVIKAALDPAQPDWMPDFVTHLPRSFTLARYFEACPFDDWNACRNLDYLLRTRALTANAAAGGGEAASVLDAFTMVVMEYVGYADAQALVAAAVAQTGFDAGRSEHGFLHLLNLADHVLEQLALRLDEDQHEAATHRLRARITTLI